MTPDHAAEFDNLTKQYAYRFPRRRVVRAVQGVSLRVRTGEVFGLVGPNRAGKTTLVKILLTLCRPTSGAVTRLGRPASDRSTLARVGYMHENQAFPRYWTAAGLLHYYGALSLLPEDVVRQRVPRLLEQVGLADRAGEPIRRFSKGMVQRLALAQALLNEPDLLVLDEPTEGLDLEGRRLVHDAVRRQRRDGKTVILVSHLAGDVEALCDRVAVLVNGRPAFVGTVAELRRPSPQTPALPLEDALRTLYEKNSR
ncbi:MAG TPA: ABC transporter ATP-binding protein [Gemmataceae bacterium]